MLPTFDHQLHLLTAGSPTATGEADQAGATDQRADHDLCEAGVGGRVHGASFGMCKEDDTIWELRISACVLFVFSIWDLKICACTFSIFSRPLNRNGFVR